MTMASSKPLMMSSSKSRNSTSPSPNPQFPTTNFIPISDSTFFDPSLPPPPPSRTVDDIWRDIVAGDGKPQCKEETPDNEMMTLEDFLMKAGAVGEDDIVGGDHDDTEVKMPIPLTQSLSSGSTIFAYDPVYQASGIESLDVIGFGNGVDGAGSGGGCGGSGGRGKRGRSVSEQLDKAAQQRQKRMIKNRESAARSRERKQHYQNELESLVVKLEEENDKLVKEKAEKGKERYKQLMENLIPVVEKRRPPRLLRRVRSSQW